ncbi:aldo/keto reductase [Marispirochaeta aestuarii]|uniref:aldo/keto reductase n=1 Tax=Marispirochaeta aestuarii TaxID=1963862 RepID=UPI0029C8D2DB|nr:aldo/keto reductase [Marispirochaeta aestuarii]
MEYKITRRDFIKTMLSATASLMTASCKLVSDDNLSVNGDAMPMRSLGSTGQMVSLLGLGGQSEVEQWDSSLAVDIINYAIDNGINYIDTNYYYGNGASETNIGLVMASRRAEVFLATKSTSRTYSGVISNFNTSLSRLQTDYVDLYQVHNIGTEDDVTDLFTSDAYGRTAIDAFVQLRDEGKARFIGITGHHDPVQLLAVLTHEDAPTFDAVLMALNPADRHIKPFQDELLPYAVSKKMAIIAMKVTGMNYLFQDIPNMTDCLNYVYSLPISCAIVGIDTIAHLEQNIQITRNFSNPLSVEEMEDLENMTHGTPLSGSPKYGDWFKIDRY